ncbi:MAG: hypothetical protein D3918_11100 [Candidatus Electrothrix sp. AX2]|nr:hypothetical protein [Candidatus Electrothrix gigas]
MPLLQGALCNAKNPENVTLDPCTRSTNELSWEKGKYGKYSFPVKCFSNDTTGWVGPLDDNVETYPTATYYDYYSQYYSRLEGPHKKEHAGVDVDADVDSSVFAIHPGLLVRGYWSEKKEMNVSFVMIEHYYKNHESGRVEPFCAVYGHVFPEIELAELDETGVPVSKNEMSVTFLRGMEVTQLFQGCNRPLPPEYLVTFRYTIFRPQVS